MLHAYGPDCNNCLIDAAGAAAIPPDATWLDLLEPNREEERLVERFTGVEVPTREEMAEIEPSSRFYQRGGAVYMTLSTLFGVEEGAPSSEPIGFVLTNDHLVTVRYADPKPLRRFAEHLCREPEIANDSLTVLVRLLDAIIDRLADELEESGAEVERISAHIFRRDPNVRKRIPAARLEALLVRIGRAQSLLARIRETAVSASRLVGYLAATPGLQQAATELEHVRSLAGDVGSLIDHSTFLAGNLTFLLDASLGLISVEQNAAMKIFAVAAVIFMPPTLIAGIYGMNFDFLPELHWPAGYPWALGLMLLSAVLPYWFFRRRGWL